MSQKSAFFINGSILLTILLFLSGCGPLKVNEIFTARAQQNNPNYTRTADFTDRDYPYVFVRLTNARDGMILRYVLTDETTKKVLSDDEHTYSKKDLWDGCMVVHYFLFNGQRFDPGKYKVEIYNQNSLVGSTGFSIN
jgi:hypothetical protein